MSYPFNVTVTFDFSNGPVFGYPFTIGSPANGILGVDVLADSASYVVDISNQVGNIRIRGGYNLLQNTFDAATMTLRLFDPNGDWNPQNTASPYYGKLVPLRKIRISVPWQGQTYYLFSGYTTAYNYTYPKDQSIGYVDISAADGFRLYNLANVSTVTGATAGQDTGTRVNKILDQIQWPNSMRKIETGGTETLLQADPGYQRTALQALKMTEFAEQGAFWVDGEGDAVFKSRAYIASTSGKNPTVFSNDGTAIPYKNIVFAFDDKLIINEADITAYGSTVTQQAIDAGSQAQYFPHSYTLKDVPVQTDADAMNIARMYVATRAQTTLRIDAMVLDLSALDNTGITAALALDYFNTATIINNGQTTSTGGDSVITKTLQIVGVAYDITPNTFYTTYTTSEPIVGSFILDSTYYGILDDTNSVLAY
jgi:hypothetical protein